MATSRYSSFSVIIFFFVAHFFDFGPFLGATPQMWKKTN